MIRILSDSSATSQLQRRQDHKSTLVWK